MANSVYARGVVGVGYESSNLFVPLRDCCKPVKHMGVDSAHLKKVLDLEPLVGLVSISVTVPTRSNTDRIGNGSSVRASAGHTRLLAFARLFFVNIDDRFDEGMI